MKRVWIVSLCVMIMCTGVVAHAQPMLETIDVQCAAAILVEQKSGQVIYEKNADARQPVASVTKTMAILLAIEVIEQGRCSLDDMLTVSKHASGMGGSQALLEMGDTHAVSVMLKSMIVASANDATVALGEFLFGSEAEYVKRMNERAQSMGMSDTHFVNATGLPAQGQYSSARDVAVMSRALAEKPLYFQFSTIWMDTVTHNNGRITELTNTNRLTRLYDGCDGIKTGSTNEAGYCISASAVRSGMRLIAVVLGANASKVRFDSAAQLLDYGFANYRTYDAAQKGARVKGRMPVNYGNKAHVELELGEDLTLLLSKSDAQDIELSPNLPEAVTAPLQKGESVGSVDIVLSGKTVAQVPVVTCEAVKRLAFPDAMMRMVNTWFLSRV